MKPDGEKTGFHLFKIMEENKELNESALCKVRIKSIRDTMDVLSGKWKIHILGTLLQVDHIRFMDLLRAVDGIAPKMLSKELQDMEMNRLITRTQVSSKPITVEYRITDYGRTIEPIIDAMANWGIAYRQSIVKE